MTTVGNEWHVRLNGGQVHVFFTYAGAYRMAATAAFAVMQYEHMAPGHNYAEVWVPELVTDHQGPYLFRFTETEVIAVDHFGGTGPEALKRNASHPVSVNNNRHVELNITVAA